MAGNKIEEFLGLSQPKPLPPPVLQPIEAPPDHFTMTGGIELADGVYWNPEALPNAHVVAIGSSGSGKTQTLKAIAYELSRTYTDARVIVIDFHGDQGLAGESRYALHQASPHGINPLKVNIDREGGGPALQAISVVNVCKRALMLGPNQEGALLGLVKQCYAARGIAKDDPETWDEEPPTFADLEQAIEEAIA